MSVNMAVIVGRLGADPELKYLENDNSVCNMSVATSESWKDRDGEKQERTEWHRVTVWGKTAEHCSKYLTKGSMVYIQGNIQTRSWEDDTGTMRYSTGINAKNVKFLGGKSTETTDSSTQTKLKNYAPNAAIQTAKDASASTDAGSASSEDEIPF